jgi:hypothetical protein
MSPFDLIGMLRVEPFEPLRIYATDGQTYDIRHPDQALVMLSRVVLPLPSTSEIPERSEHLALAHIVRVEELSSPVAPSQGPTAETA